VSFAASVAAWDFVTGLIARSPVLGAIAVGLVALFVLALLLIAGREWLALGRLKKIDALRAEADGVLVAGDLRAAQAVQRKVHGGRSGTLGSWRLTRAVLTHLVATGAVAVGDDLISSIAGGGVLSKLSRRFGEGVINGALTARVGVAAMDVCRPQPYVSQSPPSVTGLVSRAMAGLFPMPGGGKDRS